MTYLQIHRVSQLELSVTNKINDANLPRHLRKFGFFFYFLFFTLNEELYLENVYPLSDCCSPSLDEGGQQVNK